MRPVEVGGFEKGCWVELVGFRKTPVKISLIDRTLIERFVSSSRDLKEFLEDKIKESMR